MLITRGEVITFEVPHCFSEVGITPTLDINLTQNPSSILSFITFDESQMDRTVITIDSMSQVAGIYMLQIWSFSTIDPGVTVAMEYYLREDTI